MVAKLSNHFFAGINLVDEALSVDVDFFFAGHFAVMVSLFVLGEIR